MERHVSLVQHRADAVQRAREPAQRERSIFLLLLSRFLFYPRDGPGAAGRRSVMLNGKRREIRGLKKNADAAVRAVQKRVNFDRENC